MKHEKADKEAFETKSDRQKESSLKKVRPFMRMSTIQVPKTEVIPEDSDSDDSSVS